MTSFNTKQPDWYGAHQACALDTSVGEIFYVSEGGLDTNDGLTPTEPFYTIGAAMAVTTAGQDDYIIVLDYNIDHGENWPLDFNLSDVHLIGTMRTDIRAPSHFVVNTAGHTIQITADRIEIAGLSLGAGATHACIIHSGYRAQGNIHHCDFGHTTSCQDGIRLDDAQTWNWSVYHCRFGQDTAGITRDGIRHVQQAVRFDVHDNVFYVRAGGIGVNFADANIGGIITRNTFKVPDSAHGEAITIGVYNTAGTTIVNNWAANAASAITNIPYRDTGATKSHWGLNFSGIAALFPRTV